MEEFDNLFNNNLMGSCPTIVLLIKHTSVPSVQRLSYGKNITKLITAKAVIVKSGKDSYLGHSD